MPEDRAVQSILASILASSYADVPQAKQFIDHRFQFRHATALANQPPFCHRLPPPSQYRGEASQIQEIVSRVEYFGEREQELKNKDECVTRLEKVIEEKSKIIDLLQGEIEVIQKKLAVKAKALVGDAYVRADELEKQFEKLNEEINAQNRKKDALEARDSEAEQKLHDLNLKLEACFPCMFFNVVNHGVPVHLLHEMKASVLGFFETPMKMKLRMCKLGIQRRGLKVAVAGIPKTIDNDIPVVKAAHGRVPVFVDGGIRRGTDIFKALALGTSEIFIGRSVVFSLAAEGEAGVQIVLRCSVRSLSSRCP